MNTAIEYTGMPRDTAFFVFVDDMLISFVTTANVLEDTEEPISPPFSLISNSSSLSFPPVNTIDLPESTPCFFFSTFLVGASRVI